MISRVLIALACMALAKEALVTGADRLIRTQRADSGEDSGSTVPAESVALIPGK